MIEEKITIHTQRLILRPYQPCDEEGLFALEQCPQTHCYNYTMPRTRPDILQEIKIGQQARLVLYAGRLELAVILKQDNRLIGKSGYKEGNLKPDGSVEIYYSIHPAYWNQEYGTETARGLIRFGFETIKLHRIYAGATVDNVASWRIMEKVGMQRESHWREDRPGPGQWIEGKGYQRTPGAYADGYGYAILSTDNLPAGRSPAT